MPPQQWILHVPDKHDAWPEDVHSKPGTRSVVVVVVVNVVVVIVAVVVVAVVVEMVLVVIVVLVVVVVALVVVVIVLSSVAEEVVDSVGSGVEFVLQSSNPSWQLPSVRCARQNFT